jgi:hypothetical protein
MSYTVAQLRSDISGMIHGVDLSQLEGFNSLLYRSVRDLLLDVDPKETIRLIALDKPIVTNQFEYQLPVDMKGNRVIDIRPLTDRELKGKYRQQYSRDFDVSKTSGGINQFTVQWANGVKSIRISDQNSNQPVLVNGLNLLNTLAGTMTNILLNKTNFKFGGGSIQATLPTNAVPASVYMEDTTTIPLNLSTQTQGVFYLDVFIPSKLGVTSITTRWGSSIVNYYTATATQTAQGTPFQTGWNTVAFPWDTATQVGVVDSTMITYTRFEVLYDGVTQNLVFNNFRTAQGFVYEMLYYSEYIFRNAITNEFQATITSTDYSEIINLEADAANMLMHLVGKYAAQELYGNDSKFDMEFYINNYNAAKQRYMNAYPAETILPQKFYYKLPNPRMGRFTRGIK